MIVKNLGRIVLAFLLHLPLLGDAIFTQKVSKENIYLNETIKVTLELQLAKSDEIDEIYFEEYDTYQFWVTVLNERIEKKEQNLTTYTYDYLLEPKKEGVYTLNEQMIRISSKEIRDKKRWLKVYSNPINIKVAPLFNNLPIQGEYYTMNLIADNLTPKANEAINLTLYIKGKGNLKDIQKFELPLPNQTVYADSPIVNAKFTHNAYEGEVSQKFLIISNESFTLPSLELEYCNPLKKQVQIVQTTPLFVEVESFQNEYGDKPFVKYLFLIVGVLFGIIFYIIFKIVRSKYQRSKLPLNQQIQKATTNKELYQILVKYNTNNQFDCIIEKLEKSLYKKEKKYSFSELHKLALNII